MITAAMCMTLRMTGLNAVGAKIFRSAYTIRSTIRVFIMPELYAWTDRLATDAGPSDADPAIS